MRFLKLSNHDGECPVIIAPDIYKDDRGYFYESFNDSEFRENIGNYNFVQDNQSKSSYGVLRGMHFQKPPFDQAKLVRVVKGAVVDVIVDIRKGSPSYGEARWAYLSEQNHRQFFVPRGYAHGFISLADETIFQYKCDNFYNKESEGAILYNSEALKIPWELWVNHEDIILSQKDSQNVLFENFDSPFEYKNK